MKLKIFFGILAISFGISSCSQQTIDTILGATKSSTELSTAEVASGLKQALEFGAKYAGGEASKTDGFFKNPIIKLPFPPEALKVENTIRNMGLNKLADDFVLALNRSAEDACKKAAPIFISAIKQMTINDAWNILKGTENAATDYLRRTTGAALMNSFSPVINESLGKPLIPGTNISAAKSWSDITSTYNKIPLVTKVNTDLKEYATNKAIDGLFTLVAKEEARIRKDPVARTTELLKKVFAKQ